MLSKKIRDDIKTIAKMMKRSTDELLKDAKTEAEASELLQEHQRALMSELESLMG